MGYRNRGGLLKNCNETAQKIVGIVVDYMIEK